MGVTIFSSDTEVELWAGSASKFAEFKKRVEEIMGCDLPSHIIHPDDCFILSEGLQNAIDPGMETFVNGLRYCYKNDQFSIIM